MKRNRMSVRQQKFLRAVRDERLELTELVERQEISRSLLSRWLRRQVFKGALHEVNVEADRRLKLDARMALRWLFEMLSEIVKKEKKVDPGLVGAMEALANLCMRILVKKPKARRKKKINPPDRLCHPDAMDEEEELLAILNGDGEGGGEGVKRMG